MIARVIERKGHEPSPVDLREGRTRSARRGWPSALPQQLQGLATARPVPRCPRRPLASPPRQEVREGLGDAIRWHAGLRHHCVTTSASAHARNPYASWARIPCPSDCDESAKGAAHGGAPTKRRWAITLGGCLAIPPPAHPMVGNTSCGPGGLGVAGTSMIPGDRADPARLKIVSIDEAASTRR